MKTLAIAIVLLILSGCSDDRYIEMEVITEALTKCANINSDVRSMRYSRVGSGVENSRWSGVVECSNGYFYNFAVVLNTNTGERVDG
jgi:hypothetical protein